MNEIETFSKKGGKNRKRVWNKEKTKADSQLGGFTRNKDQIIVLLVKHGDILYLHTHTQLLN